MNLAEQNGLFSIDQAVVCLAKKKKETVPTWVRTTCCNGIGLGKGGWKVGWQKRI